MFLCCTPTPHCLCCTLTPHRLSCILTPQRLRCTLTPHRLLGTLTPHRLLCTLTPHRLCYTLTSHRLRCTLTPSAVTPAHPCLPALSLQLLITCVLCSRACSLQTFLQCCPVTAEGVLCTTGGRLGSLNLSTSCIVSGLLWLVTAGRRLASLRKVH